MKPLAAIATLCVLVGSSVGASAAPLTVSEAGQALAKLLDEMDVANRWLRVPEDGPRALVNWQTGLATGNTAPQRDCDKTGVRPRAKCTFCSSFVSAVVWKVGKMMKVKIPFPHPYNEDTERFGKRGQCAPRDFLSNYMQDWLSGESVTFPKKWRYTPPSMSGWLPVVAKGERGVMERAQRLANQGKLVLASYKYHGKGKPKAGHISVVRPAEKTVEKVLKEGPEMTNAGWSNANAMSFRAAFKNHSCGKGFRKAYCGKDAAGTTQSAWESMSTAHPKVLFFFLAREGQK